jgi:hypothetical protein
MMIDKTACNRPLTLDCQVSSNPSSNITWYRRRFSRAYIQRQFGLDKSKKSLSYTKSSAYSLFGANSDLDDINELYDDELIGTGPTYTIASFNCGSILNSVKNRTKSTSRAKTTTSAHPSKPKLKQRYQREKLSNDEQDPSKLSSSREYDFNKISKSAENEDIDGYAIDDVDDYAESSSFEYENDYEDESYDEDDDLSGSSSNGIEFSGDKQANEYEYDDFGIYLCEANNKLVSNNYKVDSYLSKDFQNFAAKRFIKLNPNGAPIVRALPSSSSSLAADQVMTLMMKSPIIDSSQLPVIEVPATIGASASLVCLIEPLPQFQSVLWSRDNGKIIPNSKYTLPELLDEARPARNYEINNMNNNNNNNILAMLQTTVETPVTSSASSKNKVARNFRVKYENLNSNSGKVLANSEELSDNSNSNAGGYSVSLLTSVNGVTASTDLNGIMRSVLYIKSVRKQDLGVYKCKSSNSYGSRTALILLRESTLMGMYLAIVCSVV